MKTPPLLTNRAGRCRNLMAETLSQTLQTETDHVWTHEQRALTPSSSDITRPPEASKLYVCGVGGKSQPQISVIQLMDLKLND